MSDDWANSPIPDLDVDAAQRSEPLTAEELRALRNQAELAHEASEAVLPDGSMLGDPPHFGADEMLMAIATIDARDAALRQAEEENVRLHGAMLAWKERHDLLWDQYQSALRDK